MMKRSLFLLCLTGVVPVILSLLRPVSRKYNLIKTTVTWRAAQNYCMESYNGLATIESDNDWFKLKKTLSSEPLTDVAWVGLYNDINTWKWSFFDVPLKNTFIRWYSGHPDNLGGKAACCLTSPDVQLYNYPCTVAHPFICFNANISAAGRYVGITSAMTWSDAQTYCRKFYTDLAFINSTADYNLMQSVVPGLGWSWIGLYRDSWKWSDGTNTSNLMWLAGQPDNYYLIENCGVLDNRFVFEDKKCNELHYFICHTTHPVREQQTVKLKVKSDESVIDSAMQSDILELIKMKLDENGMLQNTTVTWRVQSDGQIFHKNKKKNEEL